MKSYGANFYGRNYRELIKTVIGTLFLNVFAEEGETIEGENKETEKPNVVINYEDLIAKARKEEKEKQYSTIEKLKEQINTLTEQHNKDLLEKATLEKQVQELKNQSAEIKGDDSKTVIALKDRIRELEENNKMLEEKTNNQPIIKKEDIEKEIRSELEKEYEVKNYKLEKLAEYKDDILVPELVFGSTKEEIDNSINSALERSKQIRESLNISSRKKANIPPANPSSSTIQDKEVSFEKLATMDIRSNEYKELRKQLGLK